MSTLLPAARRPPAALGVLALAALLGSCSVRQTITLAPDLSGTWRITGTAAPFAGEAMDDLAVLGGYDGAGELYDGALAAARQDFARRPGVRSAVLARDGGHGFTADIAFSDLEGLLGDAVSGGLAGLSESGGVSTFAFVLDRSRAGRLSALVPLLRDPALSLFDPAGTAGFTEDDYVTDILGFTFGEANIPAIRASRVELVLSVPGTVTDVSGGEMTDDGRVRFSAPLSRFLVPDEGIRWSVSWRTGK